MWGFKAFIAKRDYVIASLGTAFKATETSQGATHRAKINFYDESRSKRRYYSEISGPSLNPGFGFLTSSSRIRPTPRGVFEWCVVRRELEINVALCIASGREV